MALTKIKTSIIADSAITADKIDTSSLNTAGFHRDGDSVTYENATLTGELRGPASFIIDPAGHGDNTGAVSIKGDLVVEGTTFTANATTVDIADINLTIANNAPNPAAADGAGITIDGADATLLYNATDDTLDFNKGIKVEKAHGNNTSLVNIENTTTDRPAYLSFTTATEGYTMGVKDDSNIFIIGKSEGGFTSSNDIDFSINTNGNVGIGTSNPNSRLEVATSENVNSYSDGAVQVVSSSPLAFVAPSNLNPSLNRWGFKLRENNEGDFSIHDYRQGTTRLLINTGGNVGIGTNSPQANLHVADGDIKAGDVGNTIGFGSNVGTSWYSGIKSVDEGAQNVGLTLFTTTDAGVNNVDVMTLTHEGNVGIGTSNPDRKLEVAGDILLAPSDSGTESNIWFKPGPYSAAGNFGIKVTGNNQSPYNSKYEFSTYLQPYNLVLDDGYVGMGTTNPETQLHVSGTVEPYARFENTNGTSQYVDVGTNASGKHFVFGYGSYPLLLGTGGQTRLEIKSNGQLHATGWGATTFNGPYHFDGASAVLRVGPYYTSGGDRDAILLKAGGETSVIESNNETFRVLNGSGNILFNPNGHDVKIEHGNFIVNEEGGNYDFRVESQTRTHAIFLDSGAASGKGDLLFGVSDRAGMFNGMGATGACIETIGGDGTTFVVSNKENSNVYLSKVANPTNNSFINLSIAGSTIGSITGTTSGTIYSTTSDRRLKENIEAITDGTGKVMAMKPVTHTWIADKNAPAVHGFIAQEMQEVMPEAVSGEDGGEDMMSMDYGRITPVLVAALQDALREIDILKEKVNNLENK